MGPSETFEIFLVAIPGLEAELAAEARERGFKRGKYVPGGVTLVGTWQDVWRANLELRGASRVLARIDAFRVMHLAQLDKRARRVAWSSILKPDVPFRVEAVCRKSKIYHSGAAAQRIEKAICEELGAKTSDQANVVVKARIEDDLCTLSVDTSGGLLHKRGHKEAVNKAPIRETLAALLLRKCGFDGTFPVLDPMCGSGTFVIEAAEIAAGLNPGRSRAFAFEDLATFDAQAWQELRTASAQPKSNGVTFHGSDRDAGAVAMSQANAKRSGVSDRTEFHQHAISALKAPDGPPGLVIINPPYGARLGEAAKLTSLYAALGETLKSNFAGWRVGLVATDRKLVQATRLPFGPPSAPIAHGGLKVMLFQTGPLP